MHTVELYRKVRLACRDGMSERAAALHFGISRESVKKMLCFSVPPGYRRTAGQCSGIIYKSDHALDMRRGRGGIR